MIADLFPKTANRSTTLEPQRPADTRFKREQDLVDTFSGVLRPQSNINVCFEFDSNHGIADIVIYKPTSNLNALDLSGLPPGWAYVLRVLPYRIAFTIDDFQALSGASTSQARQILRQFTEAGFTRPSKSNGKWIKHRQPLPLAREITAIEAKLTKWRHALHQASRYQHFAHYSWVLLDHVSCQPALEKIDLFAKFNIGLASVSTHGNVKTHHKPEKQEPKTPYLYWMANVKLAKELKT